VNAGNSTVINLRYLLLMVIWIFFQIVRDRELLVGVGRFDLMLIWADEDLELNLSLELLNKIDRAIVLEFERLIKRCGELLKDRLMVIARSINLRDNFDAIDHKMAQSLIVRQSGS
jgi:hypothetical protein